jgi:hypothetical protein
MKCNGCSSAKRGGVGAIIVHSYPHSAAQAVNFDRRQLASDQCQPCAWPSCLRFTILWGPEWLVPLVILSIPSSMQDFEFLAGLKRTVWLVLPDRLMCLRINLPDGLPRCFQTTLFYALCVGAVGFPQILFRSLHMALQRVLMAVISGYLPHSALCRLCLTRLDTLHDRQALARDARSSHFHGS